MFHPRTKARVLGTLIATTLCTASCDTRQPLQPPTSFDEQTSSAEVHFEASTEAQGRALARATALLDDGRRSDAIAQLRELAASSPSSIARARGVVLLAESLAADGIDDEAIGLLHDLEEISPPWGPLYFSLARIHLRLGDREAAENALRDAIHADPTLLRAYVGLASLLDEQGEDGKADLVMLQYEREIYRLAEQIDKSMSVNEQLELIEILSQATPDRRISRIIARALQSDAQRVQLRALDALERIGTDNALPALRALRDSSNDPRLQARAIEVAETIANR